jgi:hypothetical protein
LCGVNAVGPEEESFDIYGTNFGPIYLHNPQFYFQVFETGQHHVEVILHHSGLKRGELDNFISRKIFRNNFVLVF